MSFTFDALGRRRTRLVGGSLADSYSYEGVSDAVVRLARAGGDVDAALTSAGDRIALRQGTASGWLLPDLHGNVAGALAAGDTTSVTDAFRYDPYGELTASVTTSLPTPWRHGGRLPLSSPGDSELYDGGARPYDPALGTYTQLDSVMGEAQNPLSLNRYLYAWGNPTTMIDPDGHCARYMDGVCAGNHAAPNTVGARQSHRSWASYRRRHEDRQERSYIRRSTRTQSVSLRYRPHSTVGRDRWRATEREDGPAPRRSSVDWRALRKTYSGLTSHWVPLRGTKGVPTAIAADRRFAADSSTPVATVVDTTLTEISGPSEQLLANKRQGARWQSEVRQMLAQRFNPEVYELVENNAMQNADGVTIRVNGRGAPRPDFQVIHRASGRIAAVYEAKSGSLDYVLGAGRRALFKYGAVAQRLGYEPPPVEVVGNLVGPRSRMSTWVGRAGGGLMLLSIVLGTIADVKESQEWDNYLERMQVYDPDYYRQLTNTYG